VLAQGPGRSLPVPFLHGRAVQVNPTKPTLKAPRTECLKLEHEKALSNFGFKFNLRRYTVEVKEAHRRRGLANRLLHEAEAFGAGLHTTSLDSLPLNPVSAF